jgi:hypothetical protein
MSGIIEIATEPLFHADTHAGRFSSCSAGSPADTPCSALGGLGSATPGAILVDDSSYNQQKRNEPRQVEQWLMLLGDAPQGEQTARRRIDAECYSEVKKKAIACFLPETNKEEACYE